MRILVLNMKRMSSKYNKKVERLIELISELQIDAALLNKVNAKSTLANLDMIKNKLKRLGRETSVCAANSKA